MFSAISRTSFSTHQYSDDRVSQSLTRHEWTISIRDLLSAWNSCIAEAIKRFPVDLYHINDYHGAVAPLHLLPRTIPCCLSLHNAEFQGLWPMRTKTESDEVCRIYNLDPEIVEKYVQFGEVFNLLHAGASYLRVHQKGFGAVGVSKKYGKRSYARYPIFWGLKEIQALPNPDPSDTAEWTRARAEPEAVVDPVFEAGRAPLKRSAQEWAGLTKTPRPSSLSSLAAGRCRRALTLSLMSSLRSLRRTRTFNWFVLVRSSTCTDRLQPSNSEDDDQIPWPCIFEA